LASSVFGFVSFGTKAVCNIDSYLFYSIEGTLKSICMILRDGRINDAYALLRKYHDSAIINIYTDLFLQDNASITNFVVKQIDDWLQGRAALPEFRVMSQYIRNSPRVAPITALLLAEDRYKLIRNRCNDHTHYNFYSNVLYNDNNIVLPGRIKALGVFSADLQDLLILHLSYMLFANGHYMMSSDYVDCLDCGIPPEADSQYWVAPFVQELFDRTVKKARPDIAAVIKAHTSVHLA
jgi:hypothetical protein